MVYKTILLILLSIVCVNAQIMLNPNRANALTGGGGGGAGIVETGSATLGIGVTGTVIQITHGLTINTGDVVVAIVNVNGSGNTISDGNGGDSFVEQIQEDHPNATAGYAIYSRVAGGSEPSTYEFSCGSNAVRTIVIRVFSGVDTGNVWDVAPAVAGRNSASSGTTATGKDITTSNNGAMGILFTFTDGTRTFDAPTNGYGTEVEEPVGRDIASYIRIWATAGATGTSAATQSTSGNWTALQCALKPE